MRTVSRTDHVPAGRRAAGAPTTAEASGFRRAGRRVAVGMAGFTVVELLITAAILGTVSAIAVPMYFNALDAARLSRAMADIKTISMEVETFRMSRKRYPQSLAEIGATHRTDPWGHAYRYLPIAGVAKPKDARKDKNLKPINSDFDLFSVGKDGDTAVPLTAKASQDDIVRANDGGYVGLAADY